MNLPALQNFLRNTALAVSLITLLQSSVWAQVPMEPERARLLNGLRVLIWSRPADQDVWLKLRVHSGAAFDLEGKSGSMVLLGDILFPDPTTRDYFTDMQGRLDVATDQDSLTITMQGRARDFEHIVEILRTALVTTQLTPENVARVRDGRIKILKETSISATMLADRAIATRLFGDFPYGRPVWGSVESLERIDRNDLLLARDRFLSPNNATLTIIGGIQSNRAMRALRQLLGVWHKNEQLALPTFRQPAAPDPRTLIVNAPADQSVEVRFAVRGFSRQDADTPAAAVLAVVARQRWTKLIPELAHSPVSVNHEAFTLPGMFVMGAGVDTLLAGKTLAAAKDVLRALATAPVTAAELAQAKNELATATNNQLSKPDGVAQAWVDGDTYGLPSLAERTRALSRVSSEDLRRVAARLLREGTFASVIVGKSDLIKTQIEKYGKVEVMGEIEPGDQTKEQAKPAKSEPRVKPQGGSSIRP